MPPALAMLMGMTIQQLAASRSGFKHWTGPAVTLVVLLSLPGPNLLSDRWSHAQCFMAGYDLVSTYKPLQDPSARLVASGLTRNRFECLPKWLNCPKLETALPAPVSTEEWVSRYGGAYVLTTRFDLFGDGLTKHERLTLHGPSMAALSQFERLARREPPRDRLSNVWARLSGQAAPTVSDLAVELWRVPTALELFKRPNTPPK